MKTRLARVDLRRGTLDAARVTNVAGLGHN